MERSFLFVFIYHLILCFTVSSFYFQFELVLNDFLKSIESLNQVHYVQSLLYINWLIPIVTPILLCFVRSFRFNLHQSLIYNLIFLLLMNIIFYSAELLPLANITFNPKIFLIKIRTLQLAHSFLLSIIYWINLISLISNFSKNDVLIIQSCHILSTVFGNLDLNLSFKSYYFIYEMTTVLLLMVYYVFLRIDIQIKDDFKPLPLLSIKHIICGKKPIVLGSFFESFCIGALLFLYFYPYFGLFLLSITNTSHNLYLMKQLIRTANKITYFPFLCGLTFSVFTLSTFAHFKIKKSVWSMFAKNILFVYIWSLMFDLKLPYGLMDALFFFAISLNLIIQTSACIEDLVSYTQEESETISFYTFGISFAGIIISWLVLTFALYIKMFFFYSVILPDYQIYYLYSSFLIGLFLCSFNQILRDEYPYSQETPIRISEAIYV